jgi:hypothetical protein
MKNNLLVMLLFMMTALSSCTKDETSPATQSATLADLPEKATTYITNNYPDATIEYIVAMTNNAAAYIVTLNTTEELAFSTVGEFLGDGAGFHHGHHGGDTLHTDTIHGGHHGGGHHGGGHHGGIPVDSLSIFITNYITDNYSGYTIKHAELDTLCPDGAVTEVMICLTGSEPVKLIFGSGDLFLLVANRMHYTDAPQAVKDYISVNYTGFSVCEKSEKYTLADGSLEFMVYLKMSGAKKMIRMKSDGTMVCEQ